MRLKTVYVHAVALAIASLAGCTGQIGDVPSGGTGSGAANSSGTGTSTGTGATTGAAGATGTGATTGAAGATGTGATTGAAGVTGTGATAGTGATTGAAGSGSPMLHPLDLSGSPQYYRTVRLTNAQWARAVQDVLKLTTASGLEQNFQSAVIGTTDFSNNELVLDINQRSWADFQSAAETLAAQVTATDAALARVYSGTDAAGLISTLGRRAYRRPLTAAETSAYMGIYNSGSTLTGTRSAFAKGASLVIRAMLQSPHFLFRTELGTTGAPLSGYEMAAKLSLWLRGTTPSDALLDSAAGPGKLDTADGAAALATTMLGEDTAVGAMRLFHGELLHFDRYANISKLNVPSYKESFNAEYAESSFLFFDKIFKQGLGVKDILTSTTGFVGPGIAPLYGVAAPASGYAERDLGPQRVGYFSQLPFLTLHGFNAEQDSIHRGVSMSLDVLCAELGPPAAVIPPVPPLKAGQTNRQRISTLTSGCGGSCHNEQINPLGFAFEHFDGMGQYRDTENGNLTIDSTASYTFAEGTKTFSSAADLMQILATTPQVHSCYAKKLASFALQRDIVVSDMPMLTTLASTSMASGGSVKQVIIDLVRSNAFRTRVGGTP